MQHFGYRAEPCEIHIDLVASFKADFCNPEEFLKAAVSFLDETIYPGEDILPDYDGVVLKEGQYAGIIKNYIEGMEQKVDINMQEVQATYRIKFPNYEPLREEYILATANEYIMFAWATSE